ncbi:MAG TPA: pyridoxal phosphate-dependent aminotransferase family protein, partial [Gemmatimonadales bacterium]|nr:pyridoxal phosphate-dependent aminotransferase family protein [Gemmatimonadales bacterium]
MDIQTLQNVSLFEKCRQFTKAREIQTAGLYPYFKPISDSEDTSVVIEGQKRIMLGSNNYLGLTHHPKVLEAASRALHRYGSGCTGSRFLNGTLDLHSQLERALAEFLGKEECLVFSTGYSANLGLISGLIGRGEVVYLDKLDHASIVDGAKMSYGDTLRFTHGDLAGLERMIERTKNSRGAMIIVDGVYSMEGDIANVPELVRIARKYGIALALDDAHSIGVLGPNGDGTAAHFGLTEEVDLIAGTFSKSLASIGGFVAGAESVIHYLKHHSRPLIFTASLPPANT